MHLSRMTLKSILQAASEVYAHAITTSSRCYEFSSYGFTETKHASPLFSHVKVALSKKESLLKKCLKKHGVLPSCALYMK